MTYLKTVVTYHLPSEAEVDQAFLESHGLDVCLLNANTARNELGPAFYVQLQVPAEHYARAVALLKEVNPARFGSAERVAEIERGILRGFAWFLIPALTIGALVFCLTVSVEGAASDMSMPMAIASGGLAGLVSLAALKYRSRNR